MIEGIRVSSSIIHSTRQERWTVTTILTTLTTSLSAQVDGRLLLS